MSEDQLKTYEQNFEHRLKEQNAKVINYVEDKTGLKYNNDSKTIIVNDYEMDEDSNFSYTVQALKKTKTIILTHLFEFIIFVYFFIFLLESLAYIIQFHDSFITLDLSIFPQDQLVFVFWFVSPIVVWLLSTTTTFWNYHMIKMGTLIGIIVMLSFRFATFVYIMTYKFFMPFVAKARISPELTLNKILGLGYITLAIPTLICFVLVLRIYAPVYRDNIIRQLIYNYRLSDYVSLPKNTYYKYNMPIVRSMKSGFMKTVQEHDRWLHSIVIGATGAAKTSSCLLPAIYHDFKVKFRNVKRLKKLLFRHVKKGHFYFTKEMDEDNFSINYVKPNKGYEKKYNKIIRKYQSAGITVIAPDDSLTDKVYNMSNAFGFKCNRIDPKLTEDGKLKKGFKGMNPLFISPTIPEWGRVQEMVKRATLFADVMQVLNELSGTKSDPYFASINRIGTTTISMLLMLTYPRLHNGQQPIADDVLNLLNDFERIVPFADELDEMDINNEFQTIKDVIKQDFLGKGSETFSQHSRGLRVQLNNFLTNQLVRNVICTRNSVDVDQALANGEITVCNIELGELGPTDSPAFGLFFSVSFINAVLRRPGDEWTRLPHFCYVDEFPIIVSPAFESCFSLFRKFRVSMNVALQTLDQLQKSPFTQYLKGVLMNNCGHHIVFGRANSSEMKEYSELAGQEFKKVVQTGISETHMSVEDPSISHMERESDSLENILEPFMVRNRPFQQVTFLTTKKGTLLRPIHGRVFFLPRFALNKKRKKKYGWKDLYEQTRVKKPYEQSPDDNIESTPREKDIKLSNMIQNNADEVASIQINDSSSPNHDNLTKRPTGSLGTLVRNQIDEVATTKISSPNNDQEASLEPSKPEKLQSRRVANTNITTDRSEKSPLPNKISTPAPDIPAVKGNKVEQNTAQTDTIINNSQEIVKTIIDITNIDGFDE